MFEQYDPNQLRGLNFEQALYIRNNAPVGSELWHDASNIMAALQQSYQYHIDKYTKKKLNSLESY